MRCFIFFLCVFLIPASVHGGEMKKDAWQVLEPGLELGIFSSPQSAESGDSLIRILRIDPHKFTFRLLNASAPNQGKIQTARDWSKNNGLVAAINASMYQKDFKTSVSFMKTKGHLNNPNLSKDNTVLAFDRLDESVPLIQIIDRQCQDFENLSKRYETLIQSIRMISCNGQNVWTKQPKKWSTALIATDHQGKILFIHVRSPYITHDLINILLKLPLNLKNAMYVEGGPEAQLYIETKDQTFEFVGSFETGFNETNDNHRAWPVPNVVGISRKE